LGPADASDAVRRKLLGDCHLKVECALALRHLAGLIGKQEPKPQCEARKYLHATVRPSELRPFCSNRFAAQCLLDLDRRAGIAMANETKPANDNQDAGIADLAARDKLDKVVLSIGRQIAREHFETLRAANDNAVRASDIQEDGE